MSNLNKYLHNFRWTGLLACLLTAAVFQTQAKPYQVVPLPADTSGVAADTLGEPVEVAVVQETPSVDGELLRQRLAGLEKTIALNYHKTVHNFVDFFTFRKPSYTRMVMERMPVFFPLYEKYLDKYGLPDELKYLSIVESALNPRAISVASAGGLWQFMPVTGKEYGLYQDEYIDERFDPVKSTDAACRYLKRLYNIFGDWHLALAAYNSGPGTVKRAMRRSGGDSFWTVYNFLPKETRAYVPQFIAVTYMMHYGNDHGIFAENPEHPMPFDTIQVNNYFRLDVFCRLTGIDPAQLQKLNPSLISSMLPEYTRNYMLRVPSERFSYFEANRAAILDSVSRMPPLTPNMLLAAAESVEYDSNVTAYRRMDRSPFVLESEEATASPVRVAVAANPVAEAGEDLEEVVKRKPRKLVHTVRRGETLTRIAEEYHVELYDLKTWNHLRSTRVQRGQKLVILKEPKEAKPALAVREKTEPKGEASSRSTHTYKPRYHRVQDGDTLWNISQRYGGIPVDKLKKLNKIKGNTLKPGQRLIIS